MDQAFSRMVAASLLYVLCVLTPQLVLAQAAADFVSPPAEEPVPAEVPATASPAPGAPAAPEAQAPKYVAPSALELAWQELHAMQKLEAELWKRQRRPSFALPATAIALGVPMLALMLPVGALMYKDVLETSSAHAAGALIFGGIVGLAAVVLGSTAIARTRRRWRQSDDELKFLADRRTLLEGVIESDLRAAGALRAP